MENTRIKAQERFNNRPPFTSPRNLDSSCDVCSRWEAIVKLNKTKLCGDCAEEEGVEVL